MKLREAAKVSNASLGYPTYLITVPFASLMMEKMGGSFKLKCENMNRHLLHYIFMVNIKINLRD